MTKTNEASHSHDHRAAPALLHTRGATKAKPPSRLGLARKVTTLTLTSRTCKWPFGDPATADFHYCGELPQVGRPYCDAHDSMSYQTPQRKKG